MFKAIVERRHREIALTEYHNVGIDDMGTSADELHWVNTGEMGGQTGTRPVNWKVFEMLGRMARALANAESKVWRDVAEELPKSDVRVLIVNHEDDYVIAKLGFTDDSEGHGEPYWVADGGNLALGNYPHWMPLPTSPEANK